jgi:hypothetical protein
MRYSRLEKAAVIRAIHEDAEFSEFLVRYVLKQTARLTDTLVDQLFNSSEKRLARVLLLLANYGKEGWSETVINKIDQETLAHMIGSTRSRVNFFMNKFRKLGLIDYNGRIHVHSSPLSVVLHDRMFGTYKGRRIRRRPEGRNRIAVSKDISIPRQSSSRAAVYRLKPSGRPRESPMALIRQAAEVNCRVASGVVAA